MFYYSTSILEKAGVKESRVASCAVGVVSVIMTGVTVSTCFDSFRMCVQYPDFYFGQIMSYLCQKYIRKKIISQFLIIVS